MSLGLTDFFSATSMGRYAPAENDCPDYRLALAFPLQSRCKQAPPEGDEDETPQPAEPRPHDSA